MTKTKKQNNPPKNQTTKQTKKKKIKRCLNSHFNSQPGTFLPTLWLFSTWTHPEALCREEGTFTGVINSFFKLEENPGLKDWVQCLGLQISWQTYSVCMYIRITKVLHFSLSTSLHDYSTPVSNLLSAGLTYSLHLIALFMLLSEWCSLNTRHILCTINFLNLLG